MIPYSSQTITNKDIHAVIRVLRSPWLTQGPTVRRFEQAITRYTGAKYAVLFSSGTAALQAAYFAAGIGKGDEIITSPLTFAATANAALWQGAQVVFADVDPVTGTIDPEEVKKKITRRTKAIVPVDYAGHPAKLDELQRIARANNILLIEDAAHALGASYKGKRIGGIADMTMFSFHPVKSITTGEGGAITTHKKELYERLVIFRNHGITKDPKKFVRKSDGDWYHEMQALGLNYRLTDIQAALGESQLLQLPQFLNARRRIAKRYSEMFSKTDGVILPREEKGIRSSWHLYVIRLPKGSRQKRGELFRLLRKAGVGVQVHYIPVYWHPYYQKLGYHKGLCPHAEAFYQSCISIPIFPKLTLEMQNKVVRCITHALL